jgi:hypothetical protein
VPITNEEFNTNFDLPRSGSILESRVGGRDTGFCVDAGRVAIVGSAMQFRRCDGTPGQSWNIGFDN